MTILGQTHQKQRKLNCDDTFQIWMWFKESNKYFCKVENSAYVEIIERSFSHIHPRLLHCYMWLVEDVESPFNPSMDK